MGDDSIIPDDIKKLAKGAAKGADDIKDQAVDAYNEYMGQEQDWSDQIPEGAKEAVEYIQETLEYVVEAAGELIKDGQEYIEEAFQNDPTKPTGKGR